MREVFLYRCQICCTVVAYSEDKGSIWYIVECAGCKLGQFYEKIIPGVIGIGVGSHYGFRIE